MVRKSVEVFGYVPKPLKARLKRIRARDPEWKVGKHTYIAPMIP